MNITGLPLHALVVHAAVVLTPVAALAGLVFALRRDWRWLLRWPFAVTAVLATGAVVLAYYSGKSLENDRFAGATGHLADLIKTHEHRAAILYWVMYAFLVVAVLAVWALGGPSALASGRGGREERGGLALPVTALLVVACVAVLVLVLLVGDAGARAVWSQ